MINLVKSSYSSCNVGTSAITWTKHEVIDVWTAAHDKRDEESGRERWVCQGKSSQQAGGPGILLLKELSDTIFKRKNLVDIPDDQNFDNAAHIGLGIHRSSSHGMPYKPLT